MTDEPKLRLNLDRGIQKVSISIDNGDQISVNAKALTELIQLLSKIRAEMEHKEQFRYGDRINFMTSPQSVYHVDKVAEMPGAIRLLVSHPGPGFIGVVLDKTKVAELRAFIETADRPVRIH